MTDLEITELCVEAMFNRSLEDYEASIDIYDPLHDDSQAMALVKKMVLEINIPEWGEGDWIVSHGTSFIAGHSDLNRAICECVAKMQLSRAGKNEAKAQG